MIKLEDTVLPSPEQMKFAITGMRNPLNSWHRADSTFEIDDYDIGHNDHDLMSRLSKAGTEHRKYLRMMPVGVRITAPLYWWKEFETYKVGTTSNSCSTMHKIQAKEFVLDDFSTEHLISENKTEMGNIIAKLNKMRNLYLEYDRLSIEDKELYPEIKTRKDIWWQMIQMLPSSYNQTRNVTMNYEVLANIYHQRKNHRLDEWITFCRWISFLPNAELITEDFNATH